MFHLAVIGDIHSNHIALETCIRHALGQGADEFLFLGDYISDCPYSVHTPKSGGHISPPAAICFKLMRR